MLNIKKNNPSNLKMLVLSELHKTPSSGYDLIKKIAIHLNKTPSSGSIYPILSELRIEGLISFKQDGRKKIYELTKKGNKSMSSLLSEKEKALLANIKLMEHFTNVLPKVCVDKVQKLKYELLKNPKTISSYIGDWDELKIVALDLILSKDYEFKKSEVKKIIKETVLKLKKLKKLEV